jgi:arylsulfatase A-like enzyme
VTRIYDLLQPRGYATAIISSQNEAWGGMDHFLKSDHLQWFYHPETGHAQTWVSSMDRGFSSEVAAGGLVAGKFADSHTTDQAIDWITRQVRAGRPFFLSMNFQSSHFPYLMPDDVPRPFSPCELPSDISFVEYPPGQIERVRNAYCNAIHECDRQVGRLVDALRTLGQLDNTILVVTGENGEAFHEAGQVSHASEPVEPVIHVACVLHAPRLLSPRIEDYPFEHVDLVPTVLGLMGWPTHPSFQGIDVLAADRPPAEERLTYCHVLSSLAQSDAILRGGRWKLTVNQRTGASTLHDVVSDPLEEHDLLAAEPELAKQLRRLVDQWRDQQLAYYHFPSYYLNYFPPRPPRIRIDAGTL